MNANRIRNGIAAYHREQSMFLRYLRRYGAFSAGQFDRWFHRPRRMYRIRPRSGILGNTFILGVGANGFNTWAEMLDLLQMMIRLGLVDTERREGELFYIAGVAA